jgi:hypothetical protein
MGKNNTCKRAFFTARRLGLIALAWCQGNERGVKKRRVRKAHLLHLLLRLERISLGIIELRKCVTQRQAVE